MKLYIAAAAVAVATLAAAAPAAAQNYMAAGVSAETMDFAAVGAGEANITLLTGRVGHRFPDKWYGLEAELAFGVNSSDVSTAPPISVKVQTSATIYGVAYVPLGSRADLVVRAGYGHQVGTVENSGVKADTNDGAISYGAGVQVKLKDDLSLRGDYTVIDIDNVDTSRWTLTLAKNF